MARTGPIGVEVEVAVKGPESETRHGRRLPAWRVRVRDVNGQVRELTAGALDVPSVVDIAMREHLAHPGGEIESIERCGEILLP